MPGKSEPTKILRKMVVKNGDFHPMGSQSVKKHRISTNPRYQNSIPDMRNGYLDALLRLAQEFFCGTAKVEVATAT